MEYFSIIGLAFYTVPCLLPVFIIGGIIFVVYRLKKGKSLGGSNRKAPITHFFDLVVSQLAISISVLFFLYFLFSITKNFNADIEAHYVALPALVVGFILSYKLKQQLLLLLSIVGAYVWWIWLAVFEIMKMYASYRNDLGDHYYGVSSNEYRALIIIIGILMISLLFFVLGKIHSKKDSYNFFDNIYYFWSIVPVTGMLWLFSNKIVLIEGLPSLLDGDAFLLPPLLIVGLAVICISIVLLVYYAFVRNLLNNKCLASILLTLVGLGLLLFIPKMEFKPSYSDFRYTDSGPNFLGYIFLIFFNILIFGEFLLFIMYGYLKKNIGFITLGTILLFVLCIEKYVEWFSFTEKGIFFTGAGVLMLGLGFLLERARRTIINNLNTNQNSTGIDGK